MVKIATLHNGVQIHFPDETPDVDMDKVVQNHLGIGEPRPDMMGVLLDAMSKHTAAMAAAKPKDDAALKALLNAVSAHVAALGSPQRIAITPDESVNEKHHELMQMSAAHLQAANSAMQEQARGSGAIKESLEKIVENTGHAEQLIVAVNQLSTIIIEVGKSIISALQAPKEIYSDDKGKPKGVRTVK